MMRRGTRPVCQKRWEVCAPLWELHVVKEGKERILRTEELNRTERCVNPLVKRKRIGDAANDGEEGESMGDRRLNVRIIPIGILRR